ncbi:MAG: DUF2235 domain-containing protein [Lentisphaeria bacterium]|nr:DUF2235 domain-containing protein [Lentisphaeria bacterium]
MESDSAIDELRSDFEPTVWKPQPGLDLRQVWFTGVHSNIGGSYAPDKETGGLLSDIPLGWMIGEATQAGLSIEPHLAASLNGRADATLHKSRRHIYRSKRRFYRPIDHGKGPVLIHAAVKQRWDNDPKYRPRNLANYVEAHGWPTLIP